jgi:hypothetical protein
MTILVVPADAWVTLPDLGTDQVVEARGKGVYVDTTGALPYDQRAEANSLHGLHSMVIQASVIAAGVQITSGSIKEAAVYHGPI